jgi:hypothetical protein
VNTGNRVLWTAIGAVLTAAGVLGVLLNRGTLLDRDRTLLGPEAVRRWHSWGGWAVAVVIVGGLLVAVLGFLLLRAQLRGRGGAPMADLVMPRRHPAPAPEERDDDVLSAYPETFGRTRVSTSALRHSLTRDLQTNREVRGATVKLFGGHDHPEALVRLKVSADADVTRLRSHVDSALDRFAATSGVRPTVHDVVVKMADQAPPRVQ